MTPHYDSIQTDPLPGNLAPAHTFLVNENRRCASSFDHEEAAIAK
jgi:hypothetical protein